MPKKTNRVFLHIRPTAFKTVADNGITRRVASDFIIDRMTKGGTNGTKQGELAIAVDITLDPAIFAQMAIHAEIEITPENSVALLPMVEADVEITAPAENPDAATADENRFGPS